MKRASIAGIALVLGTALPATAQKPGASSVPDLPDEVSTSIEERLVTGGIIDRQSRIGEDVLILQRENDRIKALEELIAAVGLEGLRALYPDLAVSIETSPLALRSQLEVVQLVNELEEAINGPKEETPPPEAPVASAAGDEPPRGFIEMDIAPAGTIAGAEQMTPEDIERLREEEREKVRKEMELEMIEANRLPPVSLREIYGSGAEAWAVISVEGEKVKVRPGDSLPGGMTIKTIGQDSIELQNGEETVTLSIRG